MKRRIPTSSAALLAPLLAPALVLGACAPVQSYSGFRAEYNNVQIPDPVVGEDNEATVRQRFGSPSTTAVFDQNAWYYISEVQEQVAFYAPRTSARQVMVVRFDDAGEVAAVDKYGLERGRIIAYNDDSTPTRGRELGLLEQIFGSVGNSPPVGLGNSEEDNPRRR